MDNTPFSDKVRLLCEIYMEYSGDELWDEFFEVEDLGVPAAVLVYNGAATLTDIGKGFVEQSWQSLCLRQSVDPDANYESIEDLGL